MPAPRRRATGAHKTLDRHQSSPITRWLGVVPADPSAGRIGRGTTQASSRAFSRCEPRARRPRRLGAPDWFAGRGLLPLWCRGNGPSDELAVSAFRIGWQRRERAVAAHHAGSLFLGRLLTRLGGQKVTQRRHRLSAVGTRTAVSVGVRAIGADHVGQRDAPCRLLEADGAQQRAVR